MQMSTFILALIFNSNKCSFSHFKLQFIYIHRIISSMTGLLRFFMCLRQVLYHSVAPSWTFYFTFMINVLTSCFSCLQSLIGRHALTYIQSLNPFFYIYLPPYLLTFLCLHIYYSILIASTFMYFYHLWQHTFQGFQSSFISSWVFLIWDVLSISHPHSTILNRLEEVSLYWKERDFLFSLFGKYFCLSPFCCYSI